MKTLTHLDQRSRLLWTALGFLAIPLCGILDYATGPYLSLSIVYLAPIGVITWLSGKTTGVLASVVGAVTWLAADLVLREPSVPSIIPFWNASVRLAFFMITVILLSALRILDLELEGKVEERTAALTQEILERKRTEEELSQHVTHQVVLNAIIAAATNASTHLQTLLETVLDQTLIAYGLDIGAVWLNTNPEPENLFVLRGFTDEAAAALIHAAEPEPEIADIAEPSVVSDWNDAGTQFGDTVYTHGVRASIIVPLLAHGTRVGGLGIASPQPRAWKESEIDLIKAIGREVGMTVERTRSFDETKRRAAQLQALYDAGLSLNRVLELPQLMSTWLRILSKTVDADRVNFLRFDPLRQVLTLEFEAGHREGDDLAVLKSPGIAMDEARGIAHRVATDRTPLYVADVKREPLWISIDASRSGFCVPIEHQGMLRGVLTVKSDRADAFTLDDRHLILLFANQLSVALENARLFDETRQRLAELETVSTVSAALRAASTLDQMLPILAKETAVVLNATASSIWLYDPTSDTLRQIAEFGFPHLTQPEKPGQGIAGHVFTTGQIYSSPEFKSDPATEEIQRDQVPAGLGGACVPIRAADQVIGVFFVSVSAPRQLTPTDVKLLTTIAEIAGNAIHRTRLMERTKQSVRNLDALHRIDLAITSSFDTRITFNVILDQIINQLEPDAADIVLLDSSTQTLLYGARRGFRTNLISSVHLDLGEAPAGRAVVERREVYLARDIAAGCTRSFQLLIESEGFVSYYGIPLIAKGKVHGVLEIFRRQPLVPTPEWTAFIEAIAEQTAIAIDNATLFTDLQRSNEELGLAYDTTIEGWSRALELRDKETEGHTQRVAEATLQLARAFGIPESELIHIRRGALLHDIGKMAIPDVILLKPGELEKDEWEIMRRHPVHANELMSPIHYLRPALDIPYCHHEKWDGTGYPRGLKGEEIPVAARLFAIIDVWDALLSDRSYRPAWTEEKALEYIRSQVGSYFDPMVTKVFLEMVERGEISR